MTNTMKSTVKIVRKRRLVAVGCLYLHRVPPFSPVNVIPGRRQNPRTLRFPLLKAASTKFLEIFVPLRGAVRQHFAGSISRRQLPSRVYVGLIWIHIAASFTKFGSMLCWVHFMLMLCPRCSHMPPILPKVGLERTSKAGPGDRRAKMHPKLK